MTNNGAYIYDLKTKKPIGSNTNPQDGELLKAYLQVVDRDFKNESKGEGLVNDFYPYPFYKYCTAKQSQIVRLFMAIPGIFFQII